MKPSHIALAGLLAAQFLFARRAHRTLDALSAPSVRIPASRDPVSIIIPARNEALRLPILLASLLPATRPGDEIIVVDDDSQDRTVAVSASFGATVIPAGELPAGWLGKPHACSRGARAAHHDWLLFLDADTRVLDPALLDSLVLAVRESALDAVSLFARQDLQSWAETLLVPFAYRHFLAGRSQLKTLNGQCILFRRAAYEAIGGHASVRLEVAEDTALALVFESYGRPYALLDGRELLAVRMYDSAPAAMRGFGKNAGAFLAEKPLEGAATVLSTIVAGVPAGAIPYGFSRRDPVFVLAGLAAAVVDARTASAFISAISGKASSRLAGALQPLAQVLFLAGALAGILGPYVGFSRQWKGRALDGEPSRPPRAGTTAG